MVLDAARFCAEHAYEVLREERLAMGSPAMLGKSGRIVYEPLGVVGIIAPWNYPFSIPAVDALAALAVGNGVVLKPSELTPACGHKLLSLLIEAGLPAGLLQVVDGFGRDRICIDRSRCRQNRLYRICRNWSSRGDVVCGEARALRP